ncbi:MAG: hypothetical protein ACKO41_03935 [Sphingomonadales bacterium]
MDLTTLLLVALLALAIVGLIWLNKRPANQASTDFQTLPLRLQAYERLVLLTERISLPHLISRLNNPALSADEMKTVLIENIKQEFDYNSTQQLYVSATAWEAVRNLKEQNIHLINQVSVSLGWQATGPMLNKKILDILLTQPEKPLDDVVRSILNEEAKRLMR